MNAAAPNFIYITVRIFFIGYQYQFYIQSFFQCKIKPTQSCFYTGGITIINNSKVVGIFFY